MNPSASLLSTLQSFLRVDDAGRPYFRIGAQDSVDAWLASSTVKIDALSSFLAKETGERAVHSLFVFGKEETTAMGPVGATIIEGAKQYTGWGKGIAEAIQDARLRASYAQDREAYLRFDQQEARSSDDLRAPRVNPHDA